MKKGGGNSERNEDKGRKVDGQDVIKNKKKMKKNMQRLGGRGGLSLEAFANAKTRNDNYNPAIIKKQREFYRNAKYLQKFKRSIKQQQQLDIPSTSERPSEGENGAREGDNDLNKNKRNKKNAQSLQELYQKKREEEEKARMERESMIQAKKEEQQKAEARRRALKEKMLKKTKSGQPVMKYRIEHILETIQGPKS
ncbi:hypothetical protein Sango_0286800 [Sesamum angolense]|uniref:rRNA-processing protein FYV7 n=1 Tax=Sesamum angolense TaxID=2727404 RepID=A0AAE2C2Z8_9LAMI|nr:hypothetical protein Sango_0286800 [Sesamum angolense]